MLFVPEKELLLITFNHFADLYTSPGVMPEEYQMNIAETGAKKYISGISADSQCISAMNHYYFACFKNYRDRIGEIYEYIVKRLGGNTAEAMALIFDYEAGNTPMPWKEAKAVFDTFGGTQATQFQYAKEEQVVSAYSSMLKSQFMNILKKDPSSLQALLSWLDAMLAAPLPVYLSDIANELVDLITTESIPIADNVDFILSLLDKTQDNLTLNDNAKRFYSKAIKARFSKVLQEGTISPLELMSSLHNMLASVSFDIDTSDCLAAIFACSSTGGCLSEDDARKAFADFGGKEYVYARGEQVRQAYYEMLKVELKKQLADNHIARIDIISWLHAMIDIAPFEIDTSEMLVMLFSSASSRGCLSESEAKKTFSDLGGKDSKFAKREPVQQAYIAMVKSQVQVLLADSSVKRINTISWICGMVSAAPFEIDTSEFLIQSFSVGTSKNSLTEEEAKKAFVGLGGKDNKYALCEPVKQTFITMIKSRFSEMLADRSQKPADVIKWVSGMVSAAPFTIDTAEFLVLLFTDKTSKTRLTGEEAKKAFVGLGGKGNKYAIYEPVKQAYIALVKSRFSEKLADRSQKQGDVINWFCGMVSAAPFEIDTTDELIALFEHAKSGDPLKPKQAEQIFRCLDPELQYCNADKVQSAYSSMIIAQCGRMLTGGKIANDAVIDWLTGMARNTPFRVDLADCIVAIFEKSTSGARLNPAVAGKLFGCLGTLAPADKKKIQSAFTDMITTCRINALSRCDSNCFDWLCGIADASPWKEDARWISEQHTENVIFLCNLSLETGVPIQSKSNQVLLNWLTKNSISQRGLSTLQQYCYYWQQYGNSEPVNLFKLYIAPASGKDRFSVKDVPNVDQTNLKELLNELESYIGLEKVKDEVDTLLKQLVYRKKMESMGIHQDPISLHMVFTGNPGTGKTTVARLLAKIFYCMGLIKKGGDDCLVETQRADLVAGYVGQTAIKTKEVITKALGGVLFIDEAYSLVKQGSSSDYGREAIDTLLKEMEDHRSELVVIVAGYPKEMDQFIDSNPGLQSRFTRFLHFDDYNGEDLYMIFLGMCGRKKLFMTAKASERIRDHLSYLYASRTKDFANARTVRNFFSSLEAKHAARVVDENLSRKQDIFLITEQDIEGLDPERSAEEKHDSLEDYLTQLNQLVGLARVKDEVASLINLARINAAKKARGIPTQDIALHMVFAGNPGTGKTTVARIVARILHRLGYLSKDSVVEASRAELVAGYTGQTAIKVSDKVKEAMGGVLFIDEAYSLKNGPDDHFGQEAIDTLVKCMEDYRKELVVIVAGYSKEMNQFLEHNSGLQSRFNTHIHFEDYSAEELYEIFIRMCESGEPHYLLNDEAKEFAKKYWQERYKNKDEKFGNARDVRNFFEEVVKIQNNRLSRQIVDLSEMSPDLMMRIELSDLHEAAKATLNTGEEKTGLEALISQLNSMIGLDRMKEEIRVLTNLAKINKIKQERGMHTQDISLHMVFTGNPGTGKTTVARIVAGILTNLGYLSKGQLVEVSRANLVAGYLGQTAIKVQAKVKEAIGGVLFIDEAYSLKTKDDDSFGQEAIDTLVKCIEDNRKNLSVIVAGYPDDMDKFLSENPGLRSRFNTVIPFDDYTAEQLYEIFINMCSEGEEKYTLTEESKEYVLNYWKDRVAHKGKDFGNAREVRNYYEKVIKKQTSRLASNLDFSGFDDDAFMRIELSDVMV